MKLLLVLAFGWMFIGQILADAELCGWCGENPMTTATTAVPNQDRSFTWSAGEAETNKVDVLIAFDASARRWLSAQGVSESVFAAEAVVEMNAVLEQTGIDAFFTFRLAGIYSMSQDLSSADLLYLPMNACGTRKNSAFESGFSSLRQYRDTVAADVVAVLVDPEEATPYGSSMGLTSDYLTASMMPVYAKRAYCACSISTVFSRYTLIHEVGHVLGAGHSDKQNSSPGPQLRSYSAGYYFQVGDQKYTTVMGYMGATTGVGAGAERMPFFSSPDYLYQGVPVGTERKNDNTRTLIEAYSWVANFRIATPIAKTNDVEERGGTQPTLQVLDASSTVISEGEPIAANQFVRGEWSVSVRSDTTYTIKVTKLPSGLSYSSKTGKITGYPKKAGTFTAKITATAKGQSTITRSQTFSVAAMPTNLAGTYVGLLDEGGVTNLATATIYKTGKISVKRYCQGTCRTFAATGFDSAYQATISVRVKGVTTTMTIGVEDGTVRAEGLGGVLLESPWSHSGAGAPTVSKSLKVPYDDLTVVVSGKGKVRITGKRSGVRLSVTSQLVSETGEWYLPVAFPAKKGFSGWAAWLGVNLDVTTKGKVSAVSLVEANADREGESE